MAPPRTAVKPAHLTRPLIIDAALRVADESGVQSLSIRKVALKLGVTPMALYRHFSNKDELLSFALDAFIARANVIPDPDLPWDEWLLRIGRQMYVALCGDYSWVPILGSVRVGPEAARVTGAFVTRLVAAGFSRGQAVRAYFAVIQTVVGAVCLQSSMASGKPGTGEELASVTRGYLGKPNVDRLQIAPELDAVAKTNQIDIGLPMIIAALREQLS